jgi:hypothetical protein
MQRQNQNQMQIINRNLQQRFLIKENQPEVNISDGQIIKYLAKYYLKLNQNPIADNAEIITTFIGKVFCEKSNYQDGIQGIFIIPLYIWSNTQFKWLEIINYSNPNSSPYFHYPHLLMLPNQDSNHYPLYYLETCENVSSNEYNNVTDTFEL